MIFTFINFINLYIFLSVAIYSHVLSVVFPKRKGYVYRLIGSLLVCGAAAYFFPAYTNASNFAAAFFYAVFMYAFLLALALGSVAFCVKGKFVNYLYCAACGYALQHLGSNLTKIPTLFLPRLVLDENFRIEAIVNQLICFALALLLGLFLARRNKELRAVMNRKRVAFLASVIVLIDICFSSSIMLAPMYGYESYAKLEPVVYAASTSLLCVFIILTFLKQEHLEAEVMVINALYEENIRQYEVSKATMASLHDLKHRINAIVDGKLHLSEGEKKKISDEIFYLDSQAQTGNETLGIILTEKKMLCRQFGIEFVSMTDGEKLSFISTYDIFSLFGNALSNAIEAVNRQPEGNPRYISLVVKGTGNFVSVHLENSFDGEITMENGVPTTAKEDSNAHGFGVKSIRNIVEKYGGNTTISFKDGVFNLDLLFSIEQ